MPVCLSLRDRLFLKFSTEFEQRFINQGLYENRTVFQTLDLGWELASILPERELTRVKPEEIRKYGPKSE